MPVAYLPSPARGLWHLGPLPLRGYALTAILGVVVALWLTDRRYRHMGGPRGMIWDVATVAVPAGIVGARLYAVLTDYPATSGRAGTGCRCSGSGTAAWAARAWSGPAAIGAWAYCRRSGYAIGPMALAAAPAAAVAQAIATWGNWFSQRLYGGPTTLPWAVAISPEHRVNGYESFATFQPLVLYESLWDLLVAAAVAYAIRRFMLTGDRAFAVYGGAVRGRPVHHRGAAHRLRAAAAGDPHHRADDAGRGHRLRRLPGRHSLPAGPALGQRGALPRAARPG